MGLIFSSSSRLGLGLGFKTNMWFVVVCHLLVFACVVQHVDSFVPPSVTVRSRVFLF